MIEPIVSFTNVHKIYGTDQIGLQQLDLRVHPGEFVFIAGASGAGKSTLLRLLSCQDSACRGDVAVLGKNIASLTPRAVADLRRNIGMVFQDFKLLPRRTVSENIACGLEIRGVSRAVRRDVVRALLKEMGLEDKADSFPQTLSGGEQQRVAIARALVTAPKILLADEPTASLDRYMAGVVFDMLVEANRLGVTVLVATHDIDTIEALNFRTIVLDKGRLLGDFARPRGH
jgi:cell division transport system ATP-binding protein